MHVIYTLASYFSLFKMFEHFKRVEYVYIISSVECVFENLFENQNESSIENRNKKKKPLVPVGNTNRD